MLKMKKMKFTTIKVLFFKKMQILKKYQYLTRFFLVKKNDRYFIGDLYNDHKVKTLPIKLPKTSAYINSYDVQTKWNSFLIEDNGLLEKYNIVWDKVSADIEKEFDNEPVYNKYFFEN